MPLIKGNLLLQRFAELANQANRIDVAVAWATSCDAIEVLAASDADIRIVVGIRRTLQIHRHFDAWQILRNYGSRLMNHLVSFTQSFTAFSVKESSTGSVAQI